MSREDVPIKSPVQSGSKIVMWVDGRGLTLYSNKSALLSLAQRLQRIAEANPDDCFECHVRMELGDEFNLGRSGDVSVIVDKEISEFFLRLPPEAPPDAHALGFELTFMHVSEHALIEMKEGVTGA